MNDRELVEALFQRKESALRDVVTAYGALCRSVLRNLLSAQSDVEECENDVYLAVWNSIPPNRPESLAAYVASLARRIGINRFKYEHRARRNPAATLLLSELSDALPDTETPQELYGETELRDALNRFLYTLPKETRVLFLRRYFYLESVESLAKRLGKSENLIAARLYRVRKKLKKYLEQEGIRI